MKYEIYTIFDKTAVEFGRLFEAKNEAVALRMYKQMMKDNPFFSEYELIKLGHWETEGNDAKLCGFNVPEVKNVLFSPDEEKSMLDGTVVQTRG